MPPYSKLALRDVWQEESRDYINSLQNKGDWREMVLYGCRITVAHRHLLCLTFKRIKKSAVSFNKTHILGFALSRCNLGLGPPCGASGFVKKMLIKLGFIKSLASGSSVCPCFVLNIGCDFWTTRVSTQLGSLCDRSTEGEIHSGLMSQKGPFREDVHGCVCLCVSIWAHVVVVCRSRITTQVYLIVQLQSTIVSLCTRWLLLPANCIGSSTLQRVKVYQISQEEPRLFRSQQLHINHR